MTKLVERFIAWCVRRAENPVDVVTFEGHPLFMRYDFFRPDEYPDSWWDRCRDTYPIRPNKLPWWSPFNVFLHVWNPDPETMEEFHDHPRWSVTICIRGRVTEKTPWDKRVLHPGSVVIRSRRAIHAFEDCEPDTATLFIVGRRTNRQNTFKVAPQ